MLIQAILLCDWLQYSQDCFDFHFGTTLMGYVTLEKWLNLSLPQFLLKLDIMISQKEIVRNKWDNACKVLKALLPYRMISTFVDNDFAIFIYISF